MPILVVLLLWGLTQDRAEVTVSGTLSVKDESDTIHATESGSFTFVVTRPDRSRTRVSVPVNVGRWTTTLPSDAELQVVLVHLAGRPADPVFEFPKLSGDAMHLEVLWRPRVVLEVVDERGTELKDLSVAASRSSWTHEGHPGSDVGNPMGHGDSPLELDVPVWDGDHQWHQLAWVRAPGYAWQQVTLDFFVGGTERVTLQPAGDLIVTFAPGLARSTLCLRKLESDGGELAANRLIEKMLDVPEGDRDRDPSFQAALKRFELRSPDIDSSPAFLEMRAPERGGVELLGLPLGDYEVSLEVDGRVLTRSSATVAPGTRTVELPATAPEPEDVALRGEVVIPTAWEARPFSLRFDLLEQRGKGHVVERKDLTVIDRDAGRYAWDLGTVASGHYEVEVWDLLDEPLTVALLDAANGESHHLQVPAPARVAVAVVDTTDQSPAEVELEWKVLASSFSNSTSVARDPQSHQFHFDAVTESIEVTVHGDRYGDVEKTFALGPTNDLVMTVERTCGFVISIAGESPTADDAYYSWLWQPKIRCLTEDLDQDVLQSSYATREGMAFALSTPGRYQVTFGALQGYEQVAPFTVEVVRGELTKQVLTLVRSRESGMPAASPRPEPTPLLELVPRIADRVASLRGLSFKTPVKASVLSRAELRQHMTEAFDLDDAALELRAEEWTLRHLGLWPTDLDLASVLREHADRGIAGYYDPRKKELYTVALGDDQHLTMVHEVAHALEDQHVDLEPFFAAAPGEDARLARSALVEGVAQLITSFYAQRHAEQLDTEKVAGASPRSLRVMVESMLIGGALPPVLTAASRFPYEQGEALAEVIHAARGLEGLNAAFANPPASTEQVLHPEKFLAQSDVPITIELPDVAALLGAGWERVAHETSGELQIRSFGELMGTDRLLAARGAAGWGGDRYEVWLEKASQRTAFLWATTWDSEVDAQEFCRLAMQCFRNRHTMRTAATKSIEETEDRLRCDGPWGRTLIERRGLDVLIIDGPCPSLDEMAAACWPFKKRR